MLMAMIICVILVLTNIGTIIGFKSGFFEVGSPRKDPTKAVHELVGIQSFASGSTDRGYMFKCSCGITEHTGKYRQGSERQALQMFQNHVNLWESYTEEARLKLNMSIAQSSDELNDLLVLDRGLRRLGNFSEKERKSNNWKVTQ